MKKINCEGVGDNDGFFECTAPESAMKTPDYLLPALRQYRHNDCSGLLAGFDHDETIKIVEERMKEQRQMCVDKMLSALSSDCIKLVIDEAQLRKACLNAGEKT